MFNIFRKKKEKIMKKNILGHLDDCQVCNSESIESIINMGHFAPCDSLITKENINKPENTYPINLVRCKDCGLVQIDYAVNPNELFFPDYPYRSGITEVLKKNLHAIAQQMVSKVSLQKGSFVMDIGSNDGTILEGFKNEGMKVLGVEATKIANIAKEKGIDTIQEFFSENIAHEIKSKYGSPSLITAANVFAHINDVDNFMKGIDVLLDEDGYFVTESHYMLDILDTLQYDSIYHEHLRFYLVKPLQILFEKYGFKLIDIERITNYGGSIRVYAQKGLNSQVKKSVEELKKLEIKKLAYESETYVKFANRIEASRQEIRSLIIRLKDEGNKIVGIGCPGRSATLLKYCGLTPDLITYIAEQPESLKLGMYTPNTHIPIVEDDIMLRDQPEYALILSWHYAEPIIKTLRSKGLKSKIIIPLPEVRIVT
jgi:hypothetical protein